jgi:hypothetical protein
LENSSIWNLNDSSIPEFFLLDGNYEFERAANLEINLTEQINLQSLIFPLNIETVIAFSLNQKNAQIGKVISFDDIMVVVHLYNRIVQPKLIIWNITEPQQIMTIERKLVIKTNLVFTKKGNLKKNCIKSLGNYEFI